MCDEGQSFILEPPNLLCMDTCILALSYMCWGDSYIQHRLAPWGDSYIQHRLAPSQYSISATPQNTLAMLKAVPKRVVKSLRMPSR